MLLEDISADWCSGCVNGRIGLFPRTSLFGILKVLLRYSNEKKRFSFLGIASTKRMDRRRVSSCSSFHSAVSDSCELHGFSVYARGFFPYYFILGINDPIERCVTDPILSSSGAILSLKQ